MPEPSSLPRRQPPPRAPGLGKAILIPVIDPRDAMPPAGEVLIDTASVKWNERQARSQARFRLRIRPSVPPLVSKSGEPGSAAGSSGGSAVAQLRLASFPTRPSPLPPLA